jgi:pimeloyl-ACP methyl ester carboxylesterase
MDHLGIERAHWVGHSFGANVALHAAWAAPDRVQSLALLEPALPFAMEQSTAEFMLNIIGASVGKFMAGDAAGAATEWLTGAFGPGFQEVMERNLPGSTVQMVIDAPAAIGVEGASLAAWEVTPETLMSIPQPALSVFHIDPNFAGFQQTHESLLRWLPRCQELRIDDASHMLQIQQPRAVAEGLATFLRA